MENSHHQQPLATESFSYSWSVDKRPSFDNLVDKPHDDDRTDQVSSNRFAEEEEEEADDDHQNFNFDVPVSECSAAVIVHADEIFSDGYMMPAVFINNRPKLQASTSSSSSSVPTTTPIISSFSSRSSTIVVSSANNNNRSQFNFIKKWRKSSERILQKCSGFFKPICQSLRCSRKGVKVDDLGRKFWEVQRWSNYSLQAAAAVASPRQSIAYSAVDWAEMEQARGRFDVHRSLRKVNSLRNSPRGASPMRSPSSSGDVTYDVECPISEAILHCKRSIGTFRLDTNYLFFC